MIFTFLLIFLEQKLNTLYFFYLLNFKYYKHLKYYKAKQTKPLFGVMTLQYKTKGVAYL